MKVAIVVGIKTDAILKIVTPNGCLITPKFN